MRNGKNHRHVAEKRWSRRKKWRYGLAPLLLLMAVGILALDRGEGAVRKLSWLLDPVYSYGTGERALAFGGENKTGDNTGGSKVGAEAEEPLDVNISGKVQIVYGDGYREELASGVAENSLAGNKRKLEELWTGKDYTYLIQNFYIVNASTYVSEELFPVEELLEMDLTFVKERDNPQILIHHTHGSEAFCDSRKGEEEDTVIGMGTELARLLSEEYGYQVIHDKTAYDQIDGKLDRNRAYDCAREGTEAILAEYPSIQVIIDLHRDSGTKRVTNIDGKDTAQIMFFNGLSRNSNGPITYLYNPYLKENLAFSLQLKLAAMEHWADYAKPIFLKGYEYNLSLLPKSLLIEVGTEQNTIAEAKNAMIPLAEILHEVLKAE